MKCIYISLILFSIILFSLEQNKNESKKDNKWYKNISISIEKFLYKLNITKKSSCLKSIKKNIKKIYINSDIDIISDPINEINCNKSAFSYYLFVYQLTENAFINDNEKKNILKFSSYENQFSTGICIPKECEDYIENKIFYNGKINNSKIIKLFNNKLNTNNLIYLKKDNKKKEVKIEIIKYIFYTYIAFRLIISIIGEYVYSKENNYEMNINRKIIKENISEKNISENTMNIDIFREEIISKELENILEKEKKKGFLFYFNLWRNFNIYKSKNKSQWFNDEKLEIVNLFKTILLFFSVLNYHIYSILKNPTRDFFNESFYKSFLFILIKFSQFSEEIFISLDSFILSYKFFSFYKNYCIEKKENFSIIYQFIIMSIPKIILYYINFYLLHYFLNDIINSYDLYSWQKYFFNVHKLPKCLKHDFFPYYIINYHSFVFKKYSSKFDDCHKIFFIYHNEFYMLIIFIILFYFLLKIKSTKLEFLIISIIYFPYTFFFLIFKDSISNIYDRNVFYGESYTIKYIYLFIGIYFIGILTGIAYFHYNDSISPNHIINYYTPFYFISNFTKYIYESSNLLKALIFFICLFMLIFLSSSYSIFSMYYGDITFKINNIVIFLFFYEKILFIFFFNILLLIILIIDENNGAFLTKIGKISFIRLISRNSLTFFASYDYLINIFYIIFDYQFCLGYSDCFFTALGEFAFILLFSCFFGILFELPFRMLIIDYNHPNYEIDLSLYSKMN